MNTTKWKTAGLIAVVAAGFGLTPASFAGKAQKWDELPEAVRTTILANGGVAGQSVDQENGRKDGKAIYEAGIKGKDGNISDLVVLEDGKLVEVKTDDAADKAAEEAAKGNKALASLKFSHSRNITNPYLPVAILKQDILEGKEDGKSVHIERTAMPDKRKTFKIGNQDVQAFAVEDRESEDGQLSEVAMDYFAQADDGTVYYLGEDVDAYKDGKVISHEGAWMFGKDTQTPGVLMPAHPHVGDKYKSENVSKSITEEDEVLSLSETVRTPSGTYHNCLKVKETLADGGVEYKFFAPGVGCVDEVPENGDVPLKSHATRASAPN